MERVVILILAILTSAMISGCATILGEGLEETGSYGKAPDSQKIKSIYVNFRKPEKASNVFSLIQENDHNALQQHVTNRIVACFKKENISVTDKKELSDAVLNIDIEEWDHGTVSKDNQGGKIAGKIAGTAVGGAIGGVGAGLTGGRIAGSATNNAGKNNQNVATGKKFFHYSQDLFKKGKDNSLKLEDVIFFRRVTTKAYTGGRLNKDWYEQLDSAIDYCCPF